jgi:hypothetical protein
MVYVLIIIAFLLFGIGIVLCEMIELMREYLKHIKGK